jgi:hypothetical protein
MTWTTITRLANTFNRQCSPHTTHTLFYYVFSIRISFQPSRSRLASTIYICRHSSLNFAVLCLSSAHHSSPHIYSKTCPVAHHSASGLEVCSGARLLPLVGKFNGTRKSISRTLPLEQYICGAILLLNILSFPLLVLMLGTV